MLVLSRKPGERILIGNDVTVTVVRIGPNTVRLGIDAPEHLNIVREELCTREPVEASNPEQQQPRRMPPR
jgi:carbon storage regulator